MANSLGESWTSTCGYPEGDALGCVAMLIQGLWLHAAFRRRFPEMDSLIMADNWEIVTAAPLPCRLAEAAAAMGGFAAALDLEVSAKKSWVWALRAADRACLKDVTCQGGKVPT